MRDFGIRLCVGSDGTGIVIINRLTTKQQDNVSQQKESSVLLQLQWIVCLLAHALLDNNVKQFNNQVGGALDIPYRTEIYLIMLLDTPTHLNVSKCAKNPFRHCDDCCSALQLREASAGSTTYLLDLFYDWGLVAGCWIALANTKVHWFALALTLKLTLTPSQLY